MRFFNVRLLYVYSIHVNFTFKTTTVSSSMLYSHMFNLFNIVKQLETLSLVRERF